MNEAAVIGRGITIKGDVRGSGPVLIEGTVDGRIAVDGAVTIGTTGAVTAEVQAPTVTVHGRASGNLEASQRVEIKATAKVVGDVRADSIAIDAGADFRGRVYMDVGIPEGV